MIRLYIKLILIFVSIQLGMTLYELANCNSAECRNTLEKASRDIVEIEWKPISIFPEEAQRFR